MANASYKIIAADKVRGQLLVRFYNADLPEGFLVAIDLPISGGRIEPLNGKELREYIMGFCPVAEFQRVEIQKTVAPDLSYLDALVEEDHVKPPPAQVDQPRPPLPGEVSITVVRDL